MSAQPRVTKQSETRRQVLDLIERLGIGSAIPSERQLSADLGVSRLTVRAALDDLAREGHLVRKRGAGTFVQEPKIAQELTMTSFSEDMRRRGMVPGSRTLSIRASSPAPGSGGSAGLTGRESPGDQAIAARRRPADGDRDAAPARVARPRARAEGSRQRLLLRAARRPLRHPIAEGTQAIEPTVTNEEESAALGVPLHSPAFLFERTSRDEEGRTVEFVQSVYRGDRYRIVTELSRPRA